MAGHDEWDIAELPKPLLKPRDRPDRDRWSAWPRHQHLGRIQPWAHAEHVVADLAAVVRVKPHVPL